jgi:Putative transposase
VRCGANDRQALEQLCRHITRRALANERVQTNATRHVVVKLWIPWRDGTTYLVMSPLAFMQRLTKWRLCRSQTRERCVGKRAAHRLAGRPRGNSAGKSVA